MDRFRYLLDNAKFEFKQYQYDGVEWCVNNELRLDPPNNIRGGFIADEMGLGKTITMIGTMFVNLVPRTLIVVPPVLIHQWFNELYRTSGHRALLYYGVNKKLITQEQIYNARIVLTTYNSLAAKNLLLDVVWNRVIFDEAHHLRNKNKRSTACKQLKSSVKWLVTGTPVQNTIKNFYNLCTILGMSPAFYKNPDNLKVIGRNFILRRTKSQVGINIPPVNFEQCVVKWQNNTEMLLSEELHSLLPNQTGVSEIHRKQFAATFNGAGKMVAMLKARQSCILPSLLRNSIDKFCSMGLISTDYLQALDFTSKIDAVIDLIVKRKDNGKGKIVFCHFHSEIDIICKRLVEHGIQKVIKYDGRNSGGNNLLSISDVADVLVIQIQTGSEGLNLQQNFSEIYFVSPHWNPSVEDQAIARCHRIGQTQIVNVFKFEMTGFFKELNAEVDPITLEKYINKIQEEKRAISDTVLNANV